MKNIVIIDNYDSFTYNLVELFRQINKCSITIFKNDKVNIELLKDFDGIVLSPGPDLPANSGSLTRVIYEYFDKMPILGICLGHQAIYEVFGGKLVKTKQLVHGVASDCFITDNSEIIFKGITSPFKAGRYHSWMADYSSKPDCLTITSVLEDQTIMSVRHIKYNVRGIQFHPESVMTPVGQKIISNWVEYCL